MSLLRRLVLISIMGLLAGCAAPQQQQRLATPSGNPEIVVPNATRKAVIDRIVASKLEKGMQIKSVSDYGVVVGKKMDNNLMASLVYGSRYDSTPEGRITYSVVEVPEGIRVFSRTEIVTNPGSAFEQVSDVTQNVSGQMQAELESLRAIFDGSRNTPADTKKEMTCQGKEGGGIECRPISSPSRPTAPAPN